MLRYMTPTGNRSSNDQAKFRGKGNISGRSSNNKDYNKYKPTIKSTGQDYGKFYRGKAQPPAQKAKYDDRKPKGEPLVEVKATPPTFPMRPHSNSLPPLLNDKRFKNYTLPRPKDQNTYHTVVPDENYDPDSAQDSYRRYMAENQHLETTDQLQDQGYRHTLNHSAPTARRFNEEYDRRIISRNGPPRRDIPASRQSRAGRNQSRADIRQNVTGHGMRMAARIPDGSRFPEIKRIDMELHGDDGTVISLTAVPVYFNISRK